VPELRGDERLFVKLLPGPRLRLERAQSRESGGGKGEVVVE
jgi:hypothetical protein